MVWAASLFRPINSSASTLTGEAGYTRSDEVTGGDAQLAEMTRPTEAVDEVDVLPDEEAGGER